jgi:hypothetical protein
MTHTEDKASWTQFCDAIDAHRRELTKIQRKNDKMRAECANAVRGYFEAHRATACAAGAEFVVNPNRGLEVL